MFTFDNVNLVLEVYTLNIAKAGVYNITEVGAQGNVSISQGFTLTIISVCDTLILNAGTFITSPQTYTIGDTFLQLSF